MRTRLSTLIISAMFTAIIFMSITLTRVPNGFGGFIHFGDSLIFIAATLLPFPYGLVAAGMGPGLFNLMQGPQWFPFTIVIKPLMALCFTNSGGTILGNMRNRIAPFVAGAINTVLYFCANIILFDSAIAVSALPGLLIQGGGSIVFFFIIATALDRLQVKKRLGLTPAR